jgi:membrane-associated protease RseP (regulator of RpoE activity)
VSYAIGVVTFVVALLLSVMLHEAGHFATAKHFGMKASKFFVGFGPTLWRQSHPRRRVREDRGDDRARGAGAR